MGKEDENKLQLRRKRQMKERKEKIAKRMKTNEESEEEKETPEKLQQLEYLGRIEKVNDNRENNTQTWKCNFTQCAKTWTELKNDQWRGLLTHVARHAQVMNKKNGKTKDDAFLCPYCNGKHSTIKATLRHMIERNCNENRCM